jgi:hypothetical protein
MMRKTIIKEVIWLLGCLIAACLSHVFLAAGGALDINMHDTYIPGSLFGPNLSPSYFIFNYFITVGLWAYLVRALYFNFKVIPTDIILLIFAALVLYFLSDIIFIIHPPVLEPPVIDNKTPVKGLFYGGSYSNTYVWSSHIIRILLIAILAFTGFMIGRNWKKATT